MKWIPILQVQQNMNWGSPFLGGTTRTITPQMFYTHPTCRNPSFGLATKAKGLQGCEPKGSPRVKARGSPGVKARRSMGVTSHTPGSVRKCEGVWGSEPSHSQDDSHFGRWSPNGLPKLQRAITRVKTQFLVALFISLESSWNVDV
jgi:hypothetical protein